MYKRQVPGKMIGADHDLIAVKRVLPPLLEQHVEGAGLHDQRRQVAVSYTHLDVYKRQSGTWPLSLF